MNGLMLALCFVLVVVAWDWQKEREKKTHLIDRLLDIYELELREYLKRKETKQDAPAPPSPAMPIKDDEIDKWIDERIKWLDERKGPFTPPSKKSDEEKS